ncbi:MFS transporter [Deinococcus peraridilitoris]|uniref:Arabinose efflux permease family protein n=1 Tax=Deinococcus peraridilitoris (strain DSM 19664 / LMG 22246 / CIP 109416 / KR-200) TaxID=937777 RepID=L0A076_DEIPD|nr:MFS transporter [Deinococcus peraridilitoris]AFZ67288.1 arabinose efflux permease family protein [Deinococcus peraridilitoris DSM 19664]
MHSPSASGVFGPGLRPLTFGLLLCVLLIAFESLAVATILPTLARELSGLALYGWSFSAFFMGYLLSTVVLGGVADRDGPSRPFLLALTVFGAGLLLSGLAPSMEMFITGRALQGLGGGGLVAIAYLVINRAYPDALRARMLALLSSAWVVPALIGPAAASVIAEVASWRLVFLGLAPPLALVAALALPALRRLQAAGTPLDTARVRFALMAALGVSLALAALQQRAWGWAALLGVTGLLLAGPALRALFPAFPWRSRAAGAPLAAGFATRFVLTFSFFGAEAFVPLGLSELLGFSALQAGSVLTVSALVWSATSFAHSRFDERTAGRWRHRAARLGVSIVALSLGGMALALLLPGTPAWSAPAFWALGGLGMGLGFQSHTLVVFHHAPGGQEGQVSGTLQMADVLGAAIGAGIGGALLAAQGVSTGVGILFALTVLVALLGQLTTARLRPRSLSPGASLEECQDQRG